MEQYPEIPGWRRAPQGLPCIAFYKYDGSNLRWEWSKKRGWHKFGTRTELFHPSHPLWGQALPLFQKIAHDIEDRVYASDWKNRNLQKITVFTEFFGPSSFAGTHKEDEPKELRLIDVQLYKQGIKSPRWFVENFGDAPYAAQVVYEGNLNQEFIADIRAGKYPVWEGVVAKGEDWRCKIKTDAYLAKLKEVFGAKWEKFGE
jgi:hypothetical protein